MNINNQQLFKLKKTDISCAKKKMMQNVRKLTEQHFQIEKRERKYIPS